MSDRFSKIDFLFPAHRVPLTLTASRSLNEVDLNLTPLSPTPGIAFDAGCRFASKSPPPTAPPMTPWKREEPGVATRALSLRLIERPLKFERIITRKVNS